MIEKKKKERCSAVCVVHALIEFFEKLTDEVVTAVIELLKVRTIITLALVGGAIWGFINDRVSSEVFVGMFATVITYYFTKNKGE